MTPAPPEAGANESDAEESAESEGEGFPTPRPHDGEKLGEIIRSYADEDERHPKAPGFDPDSGWKVTVGSFTCAPGSDETLPCPVNAKQIPRNEPHIQLNLRRDPFPNSPGPTTEHKQFAFRSREQIREWFESVGGET